VVSFAVCWSRFKVFATRTRVVERQLLPAALQWRNVPTQCACAVVTADVVRSHARADDRILSDVKNVIFHTRSNIFPQSVIEGVVVMTAFAGLYPCSEGPYTVSPTLALIPSL